MIDIQLVETDFPSVYVKCLLHSGVVRVEVVRAGGTPFSPTLTNQLDQVVQPFLVDQQTIDSLHCLNTALNNFLVQESKALRVIKLVDDNNQEYWEYLE